MTADEQAVPTTDWGGQDPAELEALIEAVWSLDGDGDPTLFDELLHAALVYVGRIALTGCAEDEIARAATLLRSMQLRVLNGPDHLVEQP